MSVDLTLLGLIAALAYYLANARLTLNGWVLTKDLSKDTKQEIWRQIDWIARFLWASIISGLFAFVTFLARANHVPDAVCDGLRIGSLIPLAGIVIALIFFHVSLDARSHRRAEQRLRISPPANTTSSSMK